MCRSAISSISTLFEKGLEYSFWYIITYIYITITRLCKKRRFDLYDFFADGKPEKNSFLVPPQEYAVETPKRNANLNKEIDNVFCMGVNSKSEAVVANIARQPGGKILCSLFLRMSDGRIFTMPEEHRFQSEISELNTFGCARFKFQCISPMRIWRLFFNGILRQKTDIEYDSNSEKYVHIKFTFIWTASSEIFDFTSDLPADSLSHLVASSVSSESPISILKKLANNIHGYEQPGMLLGTVNIAEEKEKEIYLWGIRGRNLGYSQDVKDGNFVQIYANFINGAFLHVGLFNFPELSKKLVYGYLMRSDGFIQPVIDFHEDILNLTEEDTKHAFLSSGKYHSLAMKMDETLFEFHKNFNGNSFIREVEMSLNGFSGKGFVFDGIFRCFQTMRIYEKKLPKVKMCEAPIGSLRTKEHYFSIPFRKEICQNSELTGGKGSLLSKLYCMSSRITWHAKFSVPNGVVVSTKAYKEFVKGSLASVLEKFGENVWCSDDESHIKILCQEITERVKNAKLGENVSKAILFSLIQEFGEKFTESKFAIRSSAAGEDTMQMSAAGQMETFLGVIGTEHILEAVKKCWASQFSFKAIEYKRQYGQRLNSPMAVVIQEMIPCDVSGVCFTCDPVSGNPALLTITANYGLGESVVMSSSDPDTISLNHGFFNPLSVNSQILGRKKMKIVLDDIGTKKIETGDQFSQFCLFKETVFSLGKIAIDIESEFGFPVDIEWGIVDAQIFLFQARPVTTLDQETDFESKHWFDTYMRTENECFTKANVGEALPGAHSPLGLDITTTMYTMAIAREKYIKWMKAVIPPVPYYAQRVVNAYNHCFYCMIDGFLGFNKDDFSKSMIISLFGREMDLSSLEGIAEERHKLYDKKSESAFWNKLALFLAMFFGGKICRRAAKSLEKFSVPVNEKMSAKELFDAISHSFDEPLASAGCHMYCTMASSMWNSSVLTLLAQARGEFNIDVYSDFAYLLSTCTKVVSADVPAAIQNLGYVISRCITVEEFKKMTSEEALYWLRTAKSEAGLAFKKFLAKHGHRCTKEFDVFTETWEQNPIRLINILQTFVSENMELTHKKKIPSFSSILANLHIPLNFWQRMKLRFLLPYCQRAVRDREFSKSLLMKVFYQRRKPLTELSKKMVREGRLRKKEHMYFLSVDEISLLLKTRSPRLVSKAFHRWRVHSELDKLSFPEITHGPPIPNRSDRFDFTQNSGNIRMTGVPVRQGIVKATARVIVDMEEASTIEQGDILITYSTDVAWSPYFPLLSGVVTELGGLISHGAVIAREYGLPCIVGLHGATNVFRSGDIVVLDGYKGIVYKVDE